MDIRSLHASLGRGHASSSRMGHCRRLALFAPGFLRKTPPRVALRHRAPPHKENARARSLPRERPFFLRALARFRRGGFGSLSNFLDAETLVELDVGV